MTKKDLLYYGGYQSMELDKNFSSLLPTKALYRHLLEGTARPLCKYKCSSYTIQHSFSNKKQWE